MADNSQKNNIAEQFSALPENVKKWLASEELVFIISEIETKLGISDEKILIIPSLILRLVTQDLEPQKFIQELSKEMRVDFLVAKTITEDIEKNALRPIAAELRDKLGLEVKLIYYGKAGGEKERTAPLIKPMPAPTTAPTSSVITPKQAPLSAATPPPAQIKLEKQMAAVPSAAPSPFPTSVKPIPPASATIPTTPVIKKMEPAFESATPFILHQESSPTSAPTLNQMNQASASQTSSLPKTSLTMKVQNYFQAAGTPERTVTKPISIKVEAPAAQQAITQTEQKISIIKQPAPPISVPKTEIPSIPSTYSSSPSIQKEQPLSVNTKPMQTPSISSSAGQPRVVNYSNLRTPITDLGLPKKAVDKENIVDLRKFM